MPSIRSLRCSCAALVLLTAVVLLLAACGARSGSRHGSGRPKPAGKLALLPVKAVGVSAEVARRARGAIAAEVARATPLAVVPLGEVDQARAATATCAKPDPERPDGCALDVGRKLGASLVLVSALGGLGKTCIVQMRVLDVVKVTATRSLEETRFGDASTLPAVAGQLSLRLFPRARPKPKAWYTRWWVWTAVAVAAAAGVVIPLAISARDSDTYEEVPLP